MNEIRNTLLKIPIVDLIRETASYMQELEDDRQVNNERLRQLLIKTGQQAERISELEDENETLTIKHTAYVKTAEISDAYQNQLISQLEAERDDAQRVMKDACDATNDWRRKYDALIKACNDYYEVNGHSEGIAHVLSLLEDDDD